MKTIVLFGHVSTMQAAYMQLDLLLRDKKADDVVLMQTEGLEQAAAKGLKADGASLWYCGPTLTPPNHGWCPVEADQYLLAPTFEKLAPKVLVAFNTFMAARQGAA